MRKIVSDNDTIGIIVLIAACIIIPTLVLYAQYFNIHIFSLNGRIENIEYDIHKSMIIQVASKKHLIDHDWPKLQNQVELGDSVYKKAGDSDIILVKIKNKQRVICPYE